MFYYIEKSNLYCIDFCILAHEILNHLQSNKSQHDRKLSALNVNNENPTKNLEKIAFKMYLNKGQIKEYKTRHDLIPSQWSELSTLLTNSGIRDYSIFFDEEQSALYAVLWRTKDNTMDKLPDKEIMQKWWINQINYINNHYIYLKYIN